MSTAAIVLAAGGGRRFEGSQHKLLAELRGRPVVVWSVESALAAELDETIVVTGATDLARVLPTEVTLVTNEGWEDGLAISLAVAIDWTARQGHDAAVVGLGDQPLIGEEPWRRVAAATEKPIAVATYGGARRNPVRLDRSVWLLLDVSGDSGARGLMRRRPELVQEVACEGNPFDVDTVEDLARWS